MTAPSVAVSPPASGQIHVRPAGPVLLVLGAASTLVSFASLSWYSVSGPNVITKATEASALSSSSVLLVSPHQGSSHSTALWAVVIVGILAAAAVQLPRLRARDLLVATAITLSAVGLLDAVARASFSRLAVGNHELPPGTVVNLQPGLWVAIAGLVLVGVSALMTPTYKPAAGR